MKTINLLSSHKNVKMLKYDSVATNPRNDARNIKEAE